MVIDETEGSTKRATPKQTDTVYLDATDTNGNKTVNTQVGDKAANGEGAHINPAFTEDEAGCNSERRQSMGSGDSDNSGDSGYPTSPPNTPPSDEKSNTVDQPEKVATSANISKESVQDKESLKETHRNATNNNSVPSPQIPSSQLPNVEIIDPSSRQVLANAVVPPSKSLTTILDVEKASPASPANNVPSQPVSSSKAPLPPVAPRKIPPMSESPSKAPKVPTTPFAVPQISVTSADDQTVQTLL